MKVAALALVLIAGTAQAALPPKYQRQRELVAVLEAAVEALPTEIDRIERIAEDRYRVVAGRCAVTARIVSLPMGEMVGPRRFAVKLDRPSCR